MMMCRLNAMVPSVGICSYLLHSAPALTLNTQTSPRTRVPTLSRPKQASFPRFLRPRASRVERSVDDSANTLSVTDGLIFRSGSPGSWDSGGVGTAVVRRYVRDNEEKWCMWYQGWNAPSFSKDSEATSDVPKWTKASVGLAVSSNGVHWSRGPNAVETDELGNGGPGMVMRPNSDWWTFDTRNVGVSDVIIMSSHKVRAKAGVYWLYYSGGDAEECTVTPELAKLGMGFGPAEGTSVEALRMRPGLAMSNDGMNWARIEGPHHSGSLFNIGSEGEWDSSFIASPKVVFHEPGDLRMYYYALDPTTRKFAIGLARSRDGIQWIKMGKILEFGEFGAFDEMGACACSVIPNSGIRGKKEGYVMLYEGVSADGSRSIGVAHSDDGLLQWKKCFNDPIFSRSDIEGAWDGLSICSPCVVEMSNLVWRLYYVGIGLDGKQGIGMAESENCFGEFKRWKNTISFDVSNV